MALINLKCMEFEKFEMKKGTFVLHLYSVTKQVTANRRSFDAVRKDEAENRKNSEKRKKHSHATETIKIKLTSSWHKKIVIHLINSIQWPFRLKQIFCNTSNTVRTNRWKIVELAYDKRIVKVKCLYRILDLFQTIYACDMCVKLGHYLIIDFCIRLSPTNK